MKSAHRALAFVVSLVLLLIICSITALADNVLTLPAALKIIDEDSFYGSKSINRVVLPDSVKEIRARAFANSSLSVINLPDSLTFIDPTAFDGPNEVIMEANPGTYAYNWMLANHYQLLIPVTVGDNSVTVCNDKGTMCRFIAPSDGIYIFTATSWDYPQCTLFDSTMGYIYGDDEYDDSDEYRIEYALTKGQTIYINVYIVYSYYYDDDDDYDYSETVTLNIKKRTPDKTVYRGNNKVRLTSERKTICKFVAPSDGIYTFSTISDEDTIGYLYDSSWELISDDDDSGEDKNFSIDYVLAKGQTVYIGAKYLYLGAGSGTEILHISEQVLPQMVTVSKGKNSITVAADEEGTICKFVVPTTSIYTFTTISSADTLGVLYNSSMNEIDKDDDSGDRYNFRINHTLTKGQTVYIRVRLLSYDGNESQTITFNISMY